MSQERFVTMLKVLGFLIAFVILANWFGGGATEIITTPRPLNQP